MGVNEWKIPEMPVNKGARWIHCPFGDCAVPREQIGQHLVNCLNAPWWVKVRDATLPANP